MQGIASPKEIKTSKENNIFHIVDIVCMQGWDFFFLGFSYFESLFFSLTLVEISKVSAQQI